MATIETMRDRLSEEIGDYFKSTTTSDGADAEELIDSELAKYDDDELIDKYNTSFLIHGAVTATGEENYATSKTTSTVSMRGAYSALIPNGTVYSMHRLFSAAQKDRAIERMRKSLFPTIFLEAQYEITTVADQYTYDISSASFEDPNGAPRDVLLVDSNDAERTVPLTHWEIVPGQTNKFRFLTLPTAGRTVRLIGIKTAALSDYDDQDEELLVAFAARSLFNEAIQAAPGDVAGRSGSARDYWTQEAARLLRSNKKIPPAIREPLGFELGESDQTFLTP
jgi:hypothetical protein